MVSRDDSVKGIMSDLTETIDEAVLGTIRIEPEQENRWILGGEIDISVHERFREIWPPHRRASARVEVNMAAVTFIDSSGLRILYDARTASPEGEKPLLTDVPERARWVIDVTGLTGLFEFAETAPEA